MHVLHSVNKGSGRQLARVVLGKNGVATTLGAGKPGARGSNLADTVFTVVVAAWQETRIREVLQTEGTGDLLVEIFFYSYTHFPLLIQQNGG